MLNSQVFTLEVDHKRDQFLYPIRMPKDMEAMVRLSSWIAQYICWLITELDRGLISQLSTDQQHPWYRGRIEWLVQLMKVAGIGAEDIGLDLKKMGRSESIYGPLHLDQVAHRFSELMKKESSNISCIE